MLHAKLRNRTCQGLDRQGQGQGPSLQGPGQGQGLDLQGQGQGLTSLAIADKPRDGFVQYTMGRLSL